MTSNKDNFVHLHSHADTSILDGYSTIPELIKEVERIGQPAIAITDHGNMHGIYELFKHAKEAGIKPIAGVEAYMTPSIVNRLYRGPAYLGDGGRDDVSGRGAYTHITLLAENNEGLKNLYKMQMQSWTEGFYQKNRIDFELLELYGKGIIATTGCPSGEVQTRLRLGQEKEALEYAAKLQDILGKDNVYMELMEHGMSSELERGVRKQLLEIAKKLGMPLVATNDLHYARHSDAKGHEELLCVQTRSVMSNPPEYTGQGSRFAFEGNEYYVKTRAEMEKYFSDLPEALNNTLAIAERCEITIEPDETLRPTIRPASGQTEIEYLKTQAFEGLARRLPSKKDDPLYIDRLNTELGVIEMKNYIGYFLVVSDFVRWGKFTANPPVPTGFGRGCLSADTNVLTPLGFKKIKDIQVGDTVFDELGNQVVVPQVFEYDCDEELILIGTSEGLSNKLTLDHKVLVAKNKNDKPEWLQSKDVVIGDYVVKPSDEGYHYIQVIKIEIAPPEGKVYDFTVPTTHSYVTDAYIVHNSAAGSLLGYCLDITDIDPIKYDLLFERFINPERDSPPDIDMDFNDTDRERVIEYVKGKYGLDKVAQIVTFGKIGAKAAIKDAVRILEQPFNVGEQLSKALPEPVAGHAISLSEVYDPSAERYQEAGEFRELVKKLQADNILEVARAFEGRTRSTGVHAAALVVSNKPVVETVPMMQRQADGAMITQWDYPTCEGLGLLKVDFLGLRNLGIIANAIKNVERTKGIKIDIQDIIQGDMDDLKTYELLTRGDSLGVFQLDSCLAGDTLVSGRKIKDLYKDYTKGQGIKSTYSIDISSGTRKRNEIIRFVESGIKPVYRLVSESGRMIEATAEHRFMTDSGWKKLGDIDIDVDKVLVDQTVKTLMYRECNDCGTQLNKEQRNNSLRCYRCSASYHSNPSKKISREAIAAARTRFYAEGGEPWNKGLTKDVSPALALVSKKVQEKLKGRNIHKERMTEEEYLDYIEQMSKRMSGKSNPMYGKTTRISKRGYREDIKHYVRSSWEADYARVLNFIGEKYEYEPHTFELTRQDGSTITYTPDFYLVEKDMYVEIKGYMRELDAEKIRLVVEQYGIELDVIAESEFAELQMAYKDLVNWECPRIPLTTNWETIASIEYVNEQMTYDISMKDPLNNFLANGFMVHNSGLRSLMKLLRPNNFNDISALIALYRPGPMGVNAHTDYALRKNGEQEVIPIHPELKEALEEILGSTFQIIVYQEQIMRIAQKVADYSLAQADNLRRAMGKKKKSILDAEYVPFSEGMKKNGYGEEAIKTLWEVLIPFADYGFNKSHSVGYGALSYLTAYLKANYPVEFMSALLSSVADDTDKTALYLDDCRSNNIRVSPPDVNTSEVDYAPLDSKNIRFGFKAIRGVGEKVAEEIISVRGDRKFTSVQDFVNRVPKTLANKRILEALTLGGAFDSLGVSRKSMMEFIPEITTLITKANKKPTKAQQAKLDAAKEQASLFGDEVIEVKPIIEFEIPDNGEYSKLEKLKLERHALGLYVSGHPLEGLDLTAANATRIIDFIDEVIKPIEGWVPRDAKPMKIGGIVTSLSKKRTKKGETFAIGTVEDLTGSIPFVMFPKAFAEHGSFLELDGVYQMQGFPRKRDMDGLNFTVDAIRPLEFSDSGKLSLRIKLTEKQFESGKTALMERLAKHEASGAGSTNVIVSIKDEEGNVREEVLPINVKANPALTQEIRELFGMLSIGRWRKI
jgi:DNA polymerase III alpha subunit